MSEEEIVPCKYVHGEMVPLTEAELAERRRLAEQPTGDELIRKLRHGRNHTAGYRLSLEEKRKLKIQSGMDFEDYGQYKAWCKATGFRDLEKGEPQDAWRREAEERVAAGEEPPNEYRDRIARKNHEKRLAFLEHARTMEGR